MRFLQAYISFLVRIQNEVHSTLQNHVIHMVLPNLLSSAQSFHFQVEDSCLCVAAPGCQPDASDGVELYIDRTMKGRESLSKDMFRVLANVAGTVRSQCVADGKWTRWDAGVRADVSFSATGYAVSVAVPWKKIKGKPGEEGLAVCFRLNNNDADGYVWHEDMPGAQPDKPYTWLRCTLSE